MKVYLATDHGGFEMKEEIKRHLLGQGVEVEDCGALVNDPRDDYPDFIIPMAEKVAADAGALGIVLGRSGNGEAIAANKVNGVRCALCTSEEMARKGREHNNANVLSLGGDTIDMATAKRLVDLFLATPYSGEERHRRRIDKVMRYEERR